MLYIIAAIYGLLIGNYITTAYFRIPRGLPINGSNTLGKKPHCSYCGHTLKFYEFLPVLSWIFTRFKCNYCNARINPVYSLLEVSVGVISVILLNIIGMSPFYGLSVIVSATIILNLALFFTYYKFYKQSIFSFLAFITTLVLIL